MIEEVTLPTAQPVTVGAQEVAVKVLVRTTVEVIKPEPEPELTKEVSLLYPELAPELEEPEPDEPDEPDEPEPTVVVGMAPKVIGQTVVYRAMTLVVTLPTGQLVTVAAQEVIVYV